MCTLFDSTGLFEKIVGGLTICHMQYTWDRSTCVFFYLIEQHSKFLLHTLQVLYMCTICDSTDTQHDNPVRSKLFVACQRWWFWFVPSVPGYLREEEEHKPDPWRNTIEKNHMGLHLECIVYDPDKHFECVSGNVCFWFNTKNEVQQKAS